MTLCKQRSLSGGQCLYLLSRVIDIYLASSTASLLPCQCLKDQELAKASVSQAKEAPVACKQSCLPCLPSLHDTHVIDAYVVCIINAPVIAMQTQRWQRAFFDKNCTPEGMHNTITVVRSP